MNGSPDIQTTVLIHNDCSHNSDREIAHQKEEYQTIDSVYCANHAHDLAVIYCDNCKLILCSDCLNCVDEGTNSGKHSDHKTILLKELLNQRKELLTSNIDGFEEAMEKVVDRQEELEQLDELQDVLIKEIKGQIDRSMQMVEKAIKDRKTNLYNELQKLMNHRAQEIKTARDKLLEFQKGLETDKAKIEEIMNDQPESAPLLSMQFEEWDRLASLTERLYDPHPSEADTVAFFPTELDQLFSMIHRVGAIAVTATQADQTSIEDLERVSKCDLHEEVSVPLKICDSHGHEINNADDSGFSVQMLSPYEHAYSVEVKKNPDDGKLWVKYRIDEGGEYNLSVKFFGEHIKGSPVSIKAQGVINMMNIEPMPANKNVVKIFDDLVFRGGTKGQEDGEFSNAHGIYVTREGKILVTDSNNANIQTFSIEDGEFLSKFGVRGRDDGCLQRPVDIKETQNGNYLVSDYDNRCVSVYTSDGKYYSKFGTKNLLGPKGLCTDKNHRIIVVDNKQCCVCIFKATGKFLFKFGLRGIGEHQFAGPLFVCVNSQNDIIVTDFYNHAVKVFDELGNFMFAFGQHGMDNGQFHSPTGVAVDKNDNIFVTDWGSSRIQVFDRHGNFLNAVNSNADPLRGCQGLALYNNEKIAVVDCGNFCFKVYKFPFL